MKRYALIALLLALNALSGCGKTCMLPADYDTPQSHQQKIVGHSNEDAEGFVSIFNGKDLTDWTIKIAGEELDHNYKDTFVVEDGILKVTYDNYETFEDKFGHLFYDTPHSHYILRMDYRFVGEQCKGAPSWTYINSGVMLHSQSAASMSLEQQFPTSVEAQTLGVPLENNRKRTTANVCTPGTTVFYNGKLDRRHCISSISPTFQGDQWVAIELEVHGHDKMIFRINGKDVFELEKPQLDAGDKRDDYAAKKLIEARGGEIDLSDGYIALQAEGAPVQFRNIRIKVLDE